MIRKFKNKVVFNISKIGFILCIAFAEMRVDNDRDFEFWMNGANKFLKRIRKLHYIQKVEG